MVLFATAIIHNFSFHLNCASHRWPWCRKRGDGLSTRRKKTLRACKALQTMKGFHSSYPILKVRICMPVKRTSSIDTFKVVTSHSRRSITHAVRIPHLNSFLLQELRPPQAGNDFSTLPAKIIAWKLALSCPNFILSPEQCMLIRAWWCSLKAGEDTRSKK